MILLHFENERPLQGALGDLDWRLNGHFSRLMREQILTGKEGEVIYAPVLWNHLTFHFVVIGGGSRNPDEKRPQLSRSLTEAALKKIHELKLTQMGVSANDGMVEDPEVWILN